MQINDKNFRCLKKIFSQKKSLSCNVSSCNEAESDNEYNENEHPSGHATDASKKSQTLTAADTDSSDAGISSMIYLQKMQSNIN